MVWYELHQIDDRFQNWLTDQLVSILKDCRYRGQTEAVFKKIQVLFIMPLIFRFTISGIVDTHTIYKTLFYILSEKLVISEIIQQKRVLREMKFMGILDDVVPSIHYLRRCFETIIISNSLRIKWVPCLIIKLTIKLSYYGCEGFSCERLYRNKWHHLLQESNDSLRTHYIAPSTNIQSQHNVFGSSLQSKVKKMMPTAPSIANHLDVNPKNGHSSSGGYELHNFPTNKKGKLKFTDPTWSTDDEIRNETLQCATRGPSLSRIIAAKCPWNFKPRSRSRFDRFEWTEIINSPVGGFPTSALPVLAQVLPSLFVLGSRW